MEKHFICRKKGKMEKEKRTGKMKGKAKLVELT